MLDRYRLLMSFSTGVWFKNWEEQNRSSVLIIVQDSNCPRNKSTSKSCRELGPRAQLDETRKEVRTRRFQRSVESVQKILGAFSPEIPGPLDGRVLTSRCAFLLVQLVEQRMSMAHVRQAHQGTV